MGNICNINTSEQLDNVQSVNIISKFKLNQIDVQLSYGYYRQAKSQCLINIFEEIYLKQNIILVESATNYQQTISQIEVEKKKFHICQAEQDLSFQDIVNIILPFYESNISEEYINLFKTLLKRVFCLQKHTFMFVFFTTNQFNTLPNQILISILFQFLISASKQNIDKVKLISNDKNICNMFRLQLVKLYAVNKKLIKFQKNQPRNY